MSHEKSLCTRCGHLGYPDQVSPEKKNPAIGMTIGAAGLMAISLLFSYTSGQSKDAAAGCSGMMGGGCAGGIFLIVLLVCLVIAVGKAISNARLTDEEVCPNCRISGMIPIDSPVAQKFMADHHLQ